MNLQVPLYRIGNLTGNDSSRGAQIERIFNYFLFELTFECSRAPLGRVG